MPPQDFMVHPLPGGSLSAGFPPGPRTPEPASFPTAGDDVQPPSPPRPRLRLKRRGLPRLAAPTQNFLASVAAADRDVFLADVPIPSIEEPELTPGNISAFPPFRQTCQTLESQLPSQHKLPVSSETDGTFLSVRGRSAFSPPKTPAPGPLPSLSPSRYPNWSIDSVFSSSAESSPDPEFGSPSRPSTARSTQTSSSSLFSRFSQLSDDEHCTSPQDEGSANSSFSSMDGPYKTSSFYRGSISGIASAAGASSVGSTFENNTVAAARDNDVTTGLALASNPRQLRKGPWTRAMSSHLWATYMLYLQDPKVTPFRVGKSCVPPHGVCLRVAREAKRSWKGARAMAKVPAGIADASALNPDSASGSAAQKASEGTVAEKAVHPASSKSGSSTPTAVSGSGSVGVFMQWPHTNAATRAHLRELCRLKVSTPGGGARGLHYMSRSPTPFAQPAARYRSAAASRATPGFRSPPSSSSAFATKDMILSLSMSTSESMQPQGPLAQLTRSGMDLSQGFKFPRGAGAVQESMVSTPPTASSVVPAPSITGTTTQTAAAATTPPPLGVAASSDLGERLGQALDAGEPSFAERRRLGSPFTTRSYGPSSSSSLAAILGLSTVNSRQPHTIGPRRTLQSPVRLSRSGTQKRRSRQLGLDARKRPSLASDFFTEPASPGPNATVDINAPGAPQALEESRYDTEHMQLSSESDVAAGHVRKLFLPRAESRPLPGLTSSFSAPELTTAVAGNDGIAADMAPSSSTTGHLQPAACLQTESRQLGRLGSPFLAAGGTTAGTGNSSTSFSFPNRLSAPIDLDMASFGRPFATVQRIAQPNAVPAARTNLATRLAYIDQRLRELNNRADHRRRRSESPL